MHCKHNNDLSALIISDLVNEGITTFCIGSGSRSSSLAFALKNNPCVETILYHDERSAAFFSLGLAKANLKPVCIITTSGSAVANLAPCVMEAYMDNIPLIIITADRPFEDLDRGENQTCYQENYFGKYVGYFKNISAPPHSFNSCFISSILSYSINCCKKNKLPVHLNISFNEPLITEDIANKFTHRRTKNLPTKQTLCEESLNYIIDILSAKEKGVIIVGGNFNKNGATAIIELAEKLEFIIFADPLSGLREKGDIPLLIPYYNEIIHHTKDLDPLKPEVIIFLGGHIVSKNILLWAQSLKNCHQILVNDKTRHIDPTFNISTLVNMDYIDFSILVKEKIKKKVINPFTSIWKHYSLNIKNSITCFFDEKEELYEPMTIINLLPIFDENPWPLFLGNSLSIRYADNFLFPKKGSGNIYGNRGVSGIDGNLSTAIGICKGLNSPLLAVVGDMTFFHDVGALSLFNSLKVPLIIVVINNNGGGIFNFLPYANKSEFISSYISKSPNESIGNIAISYNIPFWKASSNNEYIKMIKHLLEEKTGGIIEVTTNKEQNVELHKQLDTYIQNDIKNYLTKEKTSYFHLKNKQTKITSYAFQDS